MSGHRKNAGPDLDALKAAALMLLKDAPLAAPLAKLDPAMIETMFGLAVDAFNGLAAVYGTGPFTHQQIVEFSTT